MKKLSIIIITVALIISVFSFVPHKSVNNVAVETEPEIFAVYHII